MYQPVNSPKNQLLKNLKNEKECFIFMHTADTGRFVQPT